MGGEGQRRVVLPGQLFEELRGEGRVTGLKLGQHLGQRRPALGVVHGAVYRAHERRVRDEAGTAGGSVARARTRDEARKQALHALLEAFECHGFFVDRLGQRTVFRASVDALAEEAIVPGVGGVVESSPAEAAEQAVVPDVLGAVEDDSAHAVGEHVGVGLANAGAVADEVACELVLA